MSKIEWTETTWSPGCLHCYAERQAARPILSGPGKPYEGLVIFGKQGPRWTGATAGPDKLDAPLRWRKGRRIFVCSMSDLFYEGFTNEQIAAVFGVMAAAPQHTFQVLTKRAERMAQWFKWVAAESRRRNHITPATWLAKECSEVVNGYQGIGVTPGWPLPNVWLGVSVESQQYAEERLPHLARCPAALRWVSYEPALEAVDFMPWMRCPSCQQPQCRPPSCPVALSNCECPEWPGLDWLVVGGESGPGARPYDLAWARSVVAQCKAAGVPVFVKQMGANPVSPSLIAEWPEDLRVRQWPEVRG